MRWQPDSRGRLEVAALELYLEQGFERTTVAEIAQRAGLAERTFFRHFADKREVLFPGGDTFESLIADAAANAPAELGALDAAFAGLEAVGAFLKERRSFAQKRQRIIAQTPELQERELMKFQSVAERLVASLRSRGVGTHQADLVAEVAVAVFKTSFDEWVRPKNTASLTTILRASLEELRAIAVPSAPRAS